jgi:hypothetical protein
VGEKHSEEGVEWALSLIQCDKEALRHNRMVDVSPSPTHICTGTVDWLHWAATSVKKGGRMVAASVRATGIQQDQVAGTYDKRIEKMRATRTHKPGDRALLTLTIFRQEQFGRIQRVLSQ